MEDEGGGGKRESFRSYCAVAAAAVSERAHDWSAQVGFAADVSVTVSIRASRNTPTSPAAHGELPRTYHRKKFHSSVTHPETPCYPLAAHTNPARETRRRDEIRNDVDDDDGPRDDGVSRVYARVHARAKGTGTRATRRNLVN